MEIGYADGNESYVTVEDEWLTNKGLDVGDVWPEEY
ncbi:hypothetical protein CIY_13490 [Butyrivibrio fibrisolvens 16/4]|nr:hypothetical protein CIY_13490 [Butyrivibrio fibrisolvens 16/4]